MKAIARRLSLDSRFAITASVIVVTLLCWYYMLYEMKMNMAPAQSWNATDLFWLFIMWAIMMAGMMLPSAIPVIRLVAQLNQRRQQKQQAYVHTSYFIIGYLISWTLYSLGITLLQYYLHLEAILSSMMDSQAPLFSGLLLILAGVYQWSPLKQKCLNFCRSPLSLISSQWREGLWGALRIGLFHGSYCVGCCWLLMATLFVVGVMNLQWILALTLLVLFEKILPYGQEFGKLAGLVAIIYGCWILV